MILKKRFWSVIVEFISFGSRRAIVFNLSGILLALKFIPPEKIGSLCMFKNFIFPLVFKSCPTGGLFMNCNCPACGLTRATAYFLHGNIEKALEMNKLIIILLVTTFALILINLYKIIHSKKIFKRLK